MSAGVVKLRPATTTMATTNARSLTPASSSANETSAADDEALALRLQGGDTGALGALYDRHALAIRRFAARAASASEADDIVHGVFLRAMARASTFEPARGPVRGWLFGIAAKIIQEWHRSLARKARALLRATPGIAPRAGAPEPVATSRARSSTSPRPNGSSSCSRRSRAARAKKSRTSSASPSGRCGHASTTRGSSSAHASADRATARLTCASPLGAPRTPRCWWALHGPNDAAMFSRARPPSPDCT